MQLWKRKKFTLVPVDRLCLGMHISMVEHWFAHPFLTNEFTLESAEQIAIIKALGMKEILWCEEHSTAQPLPEAPSQSSIDEQTAQELLKKAKEEQAARKERIGSARLKIARAKQAHRQASRTVREAFTVLHSDPAEAVGKVGPLIEETCGLFAGEAVVGLMMISDGNDNVQTAHALNVMLLSMMLARMCKLATEELREIALGALFHDIGLQKVQASVRSKKAEDRNSAEQKLYQMHAEYGVQMATTLPKFSNTSKRIVGLHHEHWDGSGYPRGLEGEKIPLAVRIVAITNRYDNLCNPVIRGEELTPSEAVSRMFALEKAHHDPNLLARFVRSMGVYPPGSIVELSNGGLASVMAANPDNSLRPSVMLWEPDVLPETATILNLAEMPDISIVRAARPSTLSEEIQIFFQTGSRLAYFALSGENVFSS